MIGTRGVRGAVTYVGWTVDLEARLARHNASLGAKFTRGRRWQLLYAEAFHDRRAAMSREWHLKRDRVLRGELRALIGGDTKKGGRFLSRP
ncbi:MAG: GIY-YIG nuclease family protein [Alphaproteobacteria bacterium]